MVRVKATAMMTESPSMTLQFTKKAVTNVEIYNGDNLTVKEILEVGTAASRGAVELTAKVAPLTADDKSVVWESKDTAIATVDQNGRVIAVAVGTTTVEVVTMDGSHKAVITIEVVQKDLVTDVTVTPASKTLEVGTAATINAVDLTETVLPATAVNKSVTWRSSNTAVATVDANGYVTAVAVGNAAITVTTVDGSRMATSNITVVERKKAVSGGTTPAPNPTPNPSPSPNPAPSPNPPVVVNPPSTGGTGGGNPVSEVLVVEPIDELGLDDELALDDEMIIEENLVPLGAIDYFDPYVSGYPDDSFRPQNAVTRAEIAAMFARILKINVGEVSDSKYSDLSSSKWFTKYIEAVTEIGLFKGYEDGTFRPNEAMSRAELAVVFSNYWKYLNIDVDDSSVQLNDVGGHWAAGYINKLYNAGVVAGFDDKTFRPQDDTTREHIVVMINKLIDRPKVTPEVSSFSDISTDYWAFGDIEAAAVEFLNNVSSAGEEKTEEKK